MHLFLFLIALTLTRVSCEVIHGDGSGDGDVIHGDGDCEKSPWLCKQLAEMRHLMDQQQRTIQQQSSMIVELSSKVDQQSSRFDQQSSKVDQQSSMIVELSSKVDQQSSIIEKQSSIIGQLESRISMQDAVTHQLTEEIETLKRTRQTDKQNVDSSPATANDASVTSEQRDVTLRSDDAGPLEAVVNQMSQQLTTMSADIQAMKNTDQVLQNANSQQDLNIQDARTSTFVHWGSAHCPSDAQVVYSGWVGGSFYNHGGGSNYLCLTMSPVFGNHAIPANRLDAYLSGAEYENYNDANHDMDAVCTVCRSSHSTTIVIPGTNVCTAGWTKQYDGFLMTERDDYNRADYVCVDSAMESRPGTSANLNGALLHFTLTQCGSLPCGPYVDNKIVTCVVCSK